MNSISFVTQSTTSINIISHWSNDTPIRVSHPAAMTAVNRTLLRTPTASDCGMSSGSQPK